MRPEKSLEGIGAMSDRKRWKLAQEKLSGAHDCGAVQNLIDHVRTHQNVQQLVYSSRLAEQIPTSYAAHAFADLQKSMLHYEVIRLCTFLGQSGPRWLEHPNNSGAGGLSGCCGTCDR